MKRSIYDAFVVLFVGLLMWVAWIATDMNQHQRQAWAAASAWDGQQVACGVAASVLLPASPIYRGWKIKLPTGAGATVYIGGADVSTSKYGMTAGEEITSDGLTRQGTDYAIGDPLYCLVAATTQTVHVLWNK